jgi:hypothetical protein
VTTWEEAKAVHARWMNDHNYQAHWAHRQRDDGRLSPAEVLGWVRGRMWDPERVHRDFYTRRSLRKLDAHGCVRFRHWRLYGELGLARKTATLWLYDETLTLEFANTPLSQFTVSESAGPHAFSPHHRATIVRDPLPLAPVVTVGSQRRSLASRPAPVQRLPEYAPRRRLRVDQVSAQQEPLFPLLPLTAEGE